MAKNERIKHLASMIAELSSRDTRLTTFGSSGHQYRVRKKLPLAELAEFERQYAVRLPRDYADFLTQLGNGGVGPYYGLYSLAESVSDAPGHRCIEFLAAPFPLLESFNPFNADNAATDDELFDDRFICGSICSGASRMWLL